MREGRGNMYHLGRKRLQRRHRRGWCLLLLLLLNGRLRGARDELRIGLPLLGFVNSAVRPLTLDLEQQRLLLLLLFLLFVFVGTEDTTTFRLLDNDSTSFAGFVTFTVRDGERQHGVPHDAVPTDVDVGQGGFLCRLRRNRRLVRADDDHVVVVVVVVSVISSGESSFPFQLVEQLSSSSSSPQH